MTIKHLKSINIKCKPQVTILKSTSKNKKSLDVLLDTGIDSESVGTRAKSSTLFIDYLQRKIPQPFYVVDTSGLFESTEVNKASRIVFERISQYILNYVDPTVELRGMRRKQY